MHDLFPPQNPGQKCGQKPGQKSSQKSGQELAENCPQSKLQTPQKGLPSKSVERIRKQSKIR